MRFISAISVLLVVVLAALSPVCVSGWSGQSTTTCSRPGARRSCATKKAEVAQATRSVCGDTLKSQPASCGLRTFVQSQFATFRSAEVSTLLLRHIANISPSLAVIIVSSIGSPETDRGPPRS